MLSNVLLVLGMSFLFGGLVLWLQLSTIKFACTWCGHAGDSELWDKVAWDDFSYCQSPHVDTVAT